MRLRRVRFTRFMQFVDQVLEIDPHVTVLVGRNDAGKTTILKWFFDQHVKEGAVHGRARSFVKGYEGDPINFSLLWETERGDEGRHPLSEAFGRDDVEQVELSFLHDTPDGKDYRMTADGLSVEIYHPDPRNSGKWVLGEVFRSRKLFPTPYYLDLGDKQIMPGMFEARFYDPSATIEAMFVRDLVPTEEMLLRLAGLHAQTRHSSGRGVEESWGSLQPRRSPATLDEIEARLADVSQRLSALLSLWWQDPQGLRIDARIGGPRSAREQQYRLNSYAITWQVTDTDGVPYYGAGLQWFITMLIELLWLQSIPTPLLVLIDEPGYRLHPTVQRILARMISTLSDSQQVIYSTHSPFMIDWSFPQRVRLIERSQPNKQAVIQNKPYHPIPGTVYQIAWDPVREAIGVSMGDMAVIGERNLLVEGVSDQIILANAAAALADANEPKANPPGVSIVPFGDDISTLARLLERVGNIGGRAVVLVDSDEAGDEVVKFCAGKGIPVLQVGQFVPGHPHDEGASIEDLAGVAGYLNAVNTFYASFSWFSPLDLTKVPKNGRSLGRYVGDVFKAQFAPREFDKIRVAIVLAESFWEDADLRNRFAPVVRDIATRLVGKW